MKTKLVILACLLYSLGGNTQEFRLNGYAGYVFDDGVSSFYSNTAYYDGKIKGGFRWGVGLEYLLKENYGLELMYFNQDTKAPTYYADGLFEKFEDFDFNASYIMLGGVRYMKKGKVEPYGGFMAGMAIFNIKNPENGNSESATNFAWGLRLGTDIFFNEKVGIKLQAELLSAVQALGGGSYYGTRGVSSGV